MKADAEFNAVADDLQHLADARGAQHAVMVMLNPDGSGLIAGSGCCCDGTLGQVMRMIVQSFARAQIEEAEGEGDAEPAEAVH